MDNFSEEVLTEVLKFYKAIGLKKSDFLKADNILGMYQILGIKPEFDENGNRRLTPYEILGVPPIIVNGKEVPIVFAIKNKSKKVKRIGKTEGPIVDFVYKNKKVQEKDSLLEQLKKQYIQALLAGDEELAAQFLQMIDELTGGRSVEVLHSFYDYTKFYRRMKKQLLIDLFNHFFLLYMLQNSVNIKNGVIKKGKVYKAFRDEYNRERQEEIADFQMGQKLLGGKGGPKISKIAVSRGDMDAPAPRPRREPIEPSKPVPPPVEKEDREREEDARRKSMLNRRRRFGRFRKFEPFEESFDPVVFTPQPIFQTFEEAVEEKIEEGITQIRSALQEAYDSTFDPTAFDPTFSDKSSTTAYREFVSDPNQPQQPQGAQPDAMSSEAMAEMAKRSVEMQKEL